ncbi:hypothetical protein ABZX77_34405 [Streptomyces sp. NPDC004237]|uniref:hypothetical protein n=1 Tax=Streptomyces sp. NPDC004237 TaxID=3154455 RepID=UPI0033AEF9C4
MDKHILPRHDPMIRNWARLAMRRPIDNMNIGTGSSHRHYLPINGVHPVGYDVNNNPLYNIAVWVINGQVDTVHPEQ